MSLSPYFYLEVYDSIEKKWEIVDPLVWNHNHTERVPADLWPFNGTHELFDILGCDRGVCSSDFPSVETGLPSDCSEEVRKEFEKYDDLCPKWFTYADAMIYYLKKPLVDDPWSEPDEDTGKVVQTDNPIKGLIDRVDAFLEVWDGYRDYKCYPSRVRIIFDVI